MSDLIKALLLGVIQGTTEFLPISSSAHLSVAELYLGIKCSQIMFNVLLHFGTVLSICVYYRKEIYEILVMGKFHPVAWLKSLREYFYDNSSDKTDSRWRLINNIILCDLITGFLALLLHQPADEIQRKPAIIGICMIITGILLAGTWFIRPRKSFIGWKGAMVTGLFQAVAVLPGISRSGATIFAALLFTKDKKEAVRFSFLAVLPLILLASIYETVKNIHADEMNVLYIALAVLISFVSGLIALAVVERVAISKKLGWFAFYLIPAGILLIAVKNWSG